MQHYLQASYHFFELVERFKSSFQNLKRVIKKYSINIPYDYRNWNSKRSSVGRTVMQSQELLGRLTSVIAFIKVSIFTVAAVGLLG